MWRNWVIFGSVVSLGATRAQAQEALVGADVLSASTALSGYVSTSYHGGTGSGKYPYALSHENRSSFTLDVVGLSFQRPLDEWLWDTGFRVDLWLGPQASDLGTSAAANDTAVLRQAYIDFRIPLGDPRFSGTAQSVDVRVGAFDSPIGLESSDRVHNAHYTHSWGYTIEPTVHTGLLAMYPGVDTLENGESDFLLSLGVANSVDAQINGAPTNEDRKTFLSGLTWLLPEHFGALGGTALSAGYVNGRERTDRTLVQNLYLAAGFPLPNVAWDLAVTYDARMLNGTGNDDSVVGAHLSYTANERTAWHLRGEWFQDGAKLFSSESAAEQGDGYGVSATLEYQLWPNTLSRAEWRWDHTEVRVNGRHNDQSWHLNLIYQF